MRARWRIGGAVMVAGVASPPLAHGAAVEEPLEPPMSFQLTSPGFKHRDAIPAQYTCDGRNISPPLVWTVPPEGAQSFALIADDPDAPNGTWVHWVAYNIPMASRRLSESVPATKELPDGTWQGITDFKRVGYGGPCPPSGTHRYFFKLYALDTALTPEEGMTKAKLEQAMQGHILGQAELMGAYRRVGR